MVTRSQNITLFHRDSAQRLTDDPRIFLKQRDATPAPYRKLFMMLPDVAIMSYW